MLVRRMLGGLTKFGITPGGGAKAGPSSKVCNCSGVVFCEPGEVVIVGFGKFSLEPNIMKTNTRWACTILLLIVLQYLRTIMAKMLLSKERIEAVVGLTVW